VEEREAAAAAAEERHAQRIHAIHLLADRLAEGIVRMERMREEEERAAQARSVAVALAELMRALEQPHHPFALHLIALRHAAHSNDLVMKALDTVPDDVAVQGVVTVDYLKNRFRRVKKHALRAALVPKDGGMWQHAWSVVAEYAKRIVKPPLQGDSPDALFARASQHIAKDNLPAAVSELEKLVKDSLPGILASDWISLAKNRLVVDQALNVVFAEVEVVSAMQ